MTITIETLRSYRPETLTTVANELQEREKQIAGLQEELNAGKPPAGWSDMYGSEPALRAWEGLRDRLNDRVAEVTRARGELDVAAEELKGAKKDLERWMNVASEQRFTVSDSGGTVSVKPPDGAEEIEGSTPEQVANGIQSALSRADAADAACASGLNAAARGEVDGGTGSIKGAGASGLSTTMTVAEQVEWARNHKIPADQVGMISPQAQEQLAHEVATAITSDDAEGIDKTTIRIMENLQGSEAYTKELFTEVSPDEFGDAVKDLSDAAFPTNGAQTVGDSRDIYKSFLTSAGVALATYTKAEGEYAPPDDFASTFASEIKDEDNPENAAALTMLVRAGGAEASFEPKFLADVTDNIYQWERSQEGGVWGDRGQGILDPFGDIEKDVSDKTGVITYTSGFANDGLANLMGGMKNTPIAAQDFFADSNGVDKDKLEYLMLKRTFSGEKGSDEGDGLGLALESAAIGDTSSDEKVPGTEMSRRDFAGAFATDVFQMVADNSGTEDKDLLGTKDAGGTFDGDSDKAWHPWEKMTDSLGAIGAGYAGDIYNEMSSGSGGRGENALLDLSKSDLTRVLNEIGSSDDQTGTQTLMSGVAAAGIEKEVGVKVEAWKAAHPNGNIQEFLADRENVSISGSNLGEVMGRIVNAADDGWNDDLAASNKQKEMVAKAFEMGSSFIPGAGGLFSDAVGSTAANAAQGQAIGAMKDAIAAQGSPSDWSDQQRVTLSDSLAYAVANEFLQQKMLGEQSNGVSGPPYQGVPGAAEGVDGPITVEDPAKGLQFDPDYWFGRTDKPSDDWQAWLESKPNADLRNGITDPIANGLDRQLNIKG